MAKNLAIDGHEAAAIHGNKSQNARQAALKGFSSGKVRILVATDIAARGIDVPNITHVINYELPDDAENYVHRIGRTARNGASGFAITLCDGTERGKLRDVERLIRKTLPTTGEIKQAEHAAPAERKPHRGQGPRPEGARANPQRAQRNAGRHFSGAKKAAISEARGEHKQPRQPKPTNHSGHVAAPGGIGATGKAWWEKPTGSGDASPPKGRSGRPQGKPGGQQKQRVSA